jgi:transmembrane sensor
MTRQTAREVDDEAAAWAVRATGESDRDLQIWLEGDPRRRGALLRAQAALSFVDRARALEDSLPPVRRGRPSRRSVLILAGGGGLIAAGLGVLGVLGAGRRYVTGVGELQRAPLADGSLAEINTDTVLEVSMRRRSREVVIRQGEAWFQVAKDPGRPFVVRAGDAQARAVGTAFSVRRREDRAELLVTEGVVEASLAGAGRVLAPAGSRLILASGRPLTPVAAPREIERALAWRTGQISLDGETLAEAAAEFNRYNRRPLLVEDPALARRRFVGLFRTSDPQSFALAVAAASGARLVEDDRAIRLR